MTGRELMESHVARFNEGVRTGDWEPMLARFTDDAEVRFENVPVGPFTGLEEIRRAGWAALVAMPVASPWWAAIRGPVARCSRRQ